MSRNKTDTGEIPDGQCTLQFPLHFIACFCVQDGIVNNSSIMRVVDRIISLCQEPNEEEAKDLRDRVDSLEL